MDLETASTVRVKQTWNGSEQVHGVDHSPLPPLWNSFVGTGIHNGPVPPAYGGFSIPCESLFETELDTHTHTPHVTTKTPKHTPLNAFEATKNRCKTQLSKPPKTSNTTETHSHQKMHLAYTTPFTKDHSQCVFHHKTNQNKPFKTPKTLYNQKPPNNTTPLFKTTPKIDKQLFNTKKLDPKRQGFETTNQNTYRCFRKASIVRQQLI